MNFGYESNGFFKRDWSDERLTYQKHKVFNTWLVRVMTVDGEEVDRMMWAHPEPTMSELLEVVRSYAKVLGARSI